MKPSLSSRGPGLRRRAGMFTLLRRPRALFRFLNDPKAPKLWQAVALLTIFYLVMPVDLIPDVIPIVGWLDDAGFVALAIAFTAAQAARYDNRRLDEEAVAALGPAR